MEEVIESAGMDTIRYWIGPNLHLIQYLLRRGELYNQVAVFKSQRYRADADDWGTQDELEEHFAGTDESVRKAPASISVTSAFNCQQATEIAEDEQCVDDNQKMYATLYALTRAATYSIIAIFIDSSLFRKAFVIPKDH